MDNPASFEQFRVNTQSGFLRPAPCQYTIRFPSTSSRSMHNPVSYNQLQVNAQSGFLRPAPCQYTIRFPSTSSRSMHNPVSFNQFQVNAQSCLLQCIDSRYEQLGILAATNQNQLSIRRLWIVYRASRC